MGSSRFTMARLNASTDRAMVAAMTSLRPPGNRRYAVGRLMLDPFSVKLYSSKAEDFEAIRRLQADGMSLTEAVEHAARDGGGTS